MAKLVLDVGQCNPDHSSISRLLTTRFSATVDRAHSYDQAIQLAGDKTYDLILINRLLDADGSPGMKILEALKANSATADVPVMVVSNYANAQEAAVASGAVLGFGKAALNTDSTLAELGKYLQG